MTAQAALMLDGMASGLISFRIICLTGLLLNFPRPVTASLLEDGEDFSNNLVSDLAPLLALFGERVTTQFMSQSTGWADCIVLAMAPVGIITIIVSAIRVAGPPWLKAIIGRARENIVAAELEVMSSTSSEACELWNGKTRAVVRCPGAADICEFICIYPTAVKKEGPEKGKHAIKCGSIKSVRIMEIDEATVSDKPKSTGHAGTETDDSKHEDVESKPVSNQNIADEADPNASRFHYLRIQDSGTRGSIAAAIEQELGDDEMAIVRNPTHPAPNMSLNCRADHKRWQLWVCAGIGIIMQAGVVIFFGFLTEHGTLGFEKDGEPVEDYAMPTATVGTLMLVAGILICAHVVEKSSTEVVYEVIKKGNECTAAVAIVWLQKQKTVSEQHFESAAVFPGMKRYSVYTSKRTIDSDYNRQGHEPDTQKDRKDRIRGLSVSTSTVADDAPIRREKPLSTTNWQLKGMTIIGTVASLIGIICQFIGLRGMHWLATIVQLGAIIVMTILRAVVSRHIAQGMKHQDLKHSSGFELEWFITSLTALDNAPWLPEKLNDPTGWQKLKAWLAKIVELHSHSPSGKLPQGKGDSEMQTKYSTDDPTWIIQTGHAEDIPQALDEEAANHEQRNLLGRKFREVSELSRAQSILDLRRYLGELGKWQGPAVTQSLAVAKAIEQTMGFFMSHSGKQVKDGHCFTWTLSVKNTWRKSQGNGNDDGDCNGKENITLSVRYSNGGWTAPVDALDAALSLWLYSVQERRQGNQDPRFPSGNDRWIRGGQIQQQRCLQILGPSTVGLLRDLEWWVPNGLDGILAAEVRQDLMQEEEEDQSFPHKVRVERIGRSGERWPIFNESKMTPFLDAGDTLSGEECKRGWKQQPDCKADQLTLWKWRSAADIRSQNSKREQEQKPQICCPLIVESQEPLANLYAKDLFSAFVWSLASHLEHSVISRNLKATIQAGNTTGSEAWKDFSLGNQHLSRLVQSIAELGLLTERETWLSFIPPLSATNNLPGLDSVIDLVQENASGPEREQIWPQAGAIYRWLFDIAMTFPPTSHIYIKSVAIMMRFYARMKGPEVRTSYSYRDDGYDYRGDGLKDEMKITRERLQAQKSQHPWVQNNLDRFFKVHQGLAPFEASPDTESKSPKRGIGTRLEVPDSWPSERLAYRTFESAQDVFDRTPLHHAMQSNVGNRAILLSRQEISELADDYAIRDLRPTGFRGGWEPGPDLLSALHAELRRYADETEKFVQESCNLPLNLMDWSDEFSSAISLPSQTCRSLLKNGADPNARDLDHLTPLHYACRILKPASGVDSFVDGFFYQPRARQRAKALILHKADVNARGLDGSTPLHCAASSGSPELVKLLIEHGGNAKAANFEGRTPLHLAAMTDVASLILDLLAAGAHIEAQDKAGRTPLHLAAMSGAAESIHELISRGAPPNVQDRFRATPLYTASIYDSYEGIEALLHARTAEGAPVSIDVGAGNARGGTALHGAASANSCRAIKAFYTFGMDVEPRDIDGSLPIHNAAISNAVEAAELLMTYMDRDSWPPTNDSGRTPFHVAAEYGNPEIIVAMIDKANKLHFAPEGILKKAGVYSFTALSMAVANGNLNAVQALLKVGQLTSTGTTVELPPPAASESGRSAGDDILKRLLEEKDDMRRTPLALAVEYRETEIFLELVKQGADISVVYENGRNLLHRAASDGNMEIARAIIESVNLSGPPGRLKTMLQQEDKEGKTPRDLAELEKQEEMLELLDRAINQLEQEEIDQFGVVTRNR
ncbi:hypothetical protein MFIFM68171_08234 [Madurella fahalii]|uniref:Ankyrin repeat protein n=1 Tax=Madurella fahalii TaxID=1157608 RepID=A0ABQ0GJT9_9PEZI